MLKHNDTIEKLDTLQKAAVVASSLDDETLSHAGLPTVGRASLEELAKKSGISYAAAARSWDGELLSRMTAEIVTEAGEGGAKLFVTPDLKTALDPAADGLSEDPYLNGLYGAAMASATKTAGGSVALAHLCVSQSEVSLLDRKEDLPSVRELVAKPFALAAQKGACDAVFLCPNRMGGGYPDTNRVFLRDAQSGYFGKDLFVIGEDVTPNAEALSLLRGKMTLGGAKLSLERAARRYTQLLKYREEGSASERDLEDAVRSGSALSEERLDEALDEVVDFCEKVSSREVKPPMGTDARRRITAESFVLLRNNGILPLAKGKHIAVIGDAYGDLTAIEKTYKVVGRVKGYDRDADRSDELLPEAVRVAGASEAAIVFLHPAENSPALPANRLALLAAIARTGTPIIALVCGDRPVDMGFDKNVAASLLVPADGPFSGDALARILSGAFSPCGRLARTAYDNTSAYLTPIAREREEGRIRIGQLVGYRRYDTAGDRIRYPFGYGLGYTTFAYSKLVVKDDEISFTVKNTGKMDGTEVAQVYIGAPSTTHVVPKKQLRAVSRVFLKVGESKTVTLKLPASSYASFDPRTMGENVESGVYRIYVGSSVSDIRLSGRRALVGVKREAVDETLADYIPNSDHGDIADVHKSSRVGAESLPPKGLRIAKRAALFLVPTLAVLFFFILSILFVSYMFDYVLFFAIEDSTAEWILCVIAIVIIALVPLLGSLNRKRVVSIKRFSLTVSPVLVLAAIVFVYLFAIAQDNENRKMILLVLSALAGGAVLMAILSTVVDRELRKQKFNADRWAKFYHVPDRVESTTTSEQFEEAFRLDEEARKKAAAEAKRTVEETPAYDIPQFYDKYLTYETLLTDCKQYLKERGYAVEDSFLRDYLGAVSSTQLILIPKGDGAELCSAIASYFGRDAYIDNAEEYNETEDLFNRWKQSEHAMVTTNFGFALVEAKRQSAFLHTVLIRHMDPSRLEAILTPIVNALSRRTTSVFVPGKMDILLPPNLLMVVELEQDNTNGIPAAIAEIAATVSPSYKAEEPSAKRSVFHSVGFERLNSLKSSVRDDFPISEAAWKPIDRLDERCRSGHIGNLLWVRLERHACVSLASGAKEAEALKSALYTEGYAWLAATWNEELCGGDLKSAILELFGSAEPAKEAAAGRRTKA